MNAASAAFLGIALATGCAAPSSERGSAIALDGRGSTAAADALSTPADPLTAGIDAVFAELDRGDAPGCAVGVVRRGELVHARGYGMADLERGVPITSKTVFDLGSTSKQFTAACVLLLAQEGDLELGDDVRDWLPEMPDYGPSITIRHLLHHTSGLRDYLTLFALAGISDEDLTTNEDALAMLARQKGLNFDPGTEHLYSNSNYLLLSVIVERASGTPFAEFARQRIFQPLGMDRTHVHDDHRTIVPGRAIGYARLEDGTFGIELSDFEQTGDGAVLTTVEDLARWDANFYAPLIGGAALLDGLRTKGRLDGGEEIDYARGLMLGRAGELDFECHAGAWAGYRAQFLRFPSERLSVICLCNRSDVDPSAFAWRIAATIVGDKLGRAPERRPPNASANVGAEAVEAETEASADCVGAYESEELGVTYEITRGEDGLLVGVRARGGRLPLVPEGKDRFGVEGAVLRIERGPDGTVVGFSIDAGRVRDIRFARR